MPDPFAAFLNDRGVVVLDGGLATELERRGADLRDPLWSAKVLIESPQLIRDVHRDYYAAGADVATSASYQATVQGFEARGIGADEAVDLLRLSVTLALEAREEFWEVPEHRNGRRRPLVAASIGPYGAYLHDGSEYHGDYGLSVRALMDFHRPRMAVLAASGADLLALETVPSLLEAQALLRLLSEFPEIPAWLSFSCCDGEHVCHGERFAEGVQIANTARQVVAVGLNCTAPRFVEGLLATAAQRSHKPLVVYPNRGERWNANTKQWVTTENAPTEFSPQRWYQLGARIIGGCCRTTPEDIRTVTSALAQ